MTEVRAVVVGGGVVGCSAAYHLAKLGWDGVVLLEQGELAGGTTWHAAGMIGRLRTSTSLTRINDHSAELYAGLAEETGVPTGWTPCGSLIVAASEARLVQLQRTAAMAELFGVEARLITPQECGERWPLIQVEDVLGGVWLPGDGKVVPRDLCLSLAAGARAHGATIREGVRVTALVRDGDRVTGVETSDGPIAADVVVLCGGMWSRQLALGIGVDLPLWPAEHHYVVSEPLGGVHHDLPNGRDPDGLIYFRSDGDRIMLGAFQPRARAWDVERVPDDFSFQLLEEDWQSYEEPLRAARHRIPALEGAALPDFVNGPESFTPDNNFLMGEPPGLDGLFVLCGFNSAGIACAGGAGHVLAQWLEGGAPPMDLWSVDVRRFAPFHNRPGFLRERVTEVLGLHYQMAWPNRELETARGARKTPLHETLAAKGACFGQKMGWERPNWYAPPGTEPAVRYSFGRQNWHEAVAEECRATRDGVAVFEQCSFSKYSFGGADAVRTLQRLCANDVDVPHGRSVYTAMLDERGRFQSDLTVLRVAGDRYYIVTATAQTVRDADWIRRHVPRGADATLVDATDERGVLGVMGPRSRELLAGLTGADLAHGSFPFGSAIGSSIAGREVHMLRVTYVGELGWELHLALEDTPAVYAALHEAGAPLGLRDAGHYAINSMRLEKAYRAWGHELSPDDTPLEAGLSFAVAWDKPGGFLGREALLLQRERGATRRMLALVLDDPEPTLWGDEPILRDGVAVGHTTSGAYGHRLGAAVGLGYARNDAGASPDWIRAGRWEVRVGAELVPASAHLRAPYDPDRARILC